MMSNEVAENEVSEATESEVDAQDEQPTAAQPHSAPEPEPKTEELDTEPNAETVKSSVDWDSVKLPDGLQVDDELFGSFKEVIQEAGVSSNEAVEKLVDLHVKALQKQWEAYQEVRKGWREQAAKELGDNIDSILNTIRDAMVSYAPDVMDDFLDVMDETGLGDHPAVIKVLYALASNLKEGSFTPGNRAATVDEIPPEQILYGSKKE